MSNMVFLSNYKLFFCGERGKHKNTYIFHLSNEILEIRSNMNEGRLKHGLIKLSSLIYIFGGLGSDTAEIHDLTTDTWTMINNKLPE